MAALPAGGVALYLVLRSGAIPTNDYWWLFPKFLGPAGLATGWEPWFSRANEHLLAGSYALYALNLGLSRGANWGLGVLAWLAALAQYLLLCGHLARARPPGFWRAAGVAAFCFTPAAAQVWVVGFSGIHWCWSNLLSIAALIALLRYLDDRRGRLLVAHLGLGLAATLVYGSALALWPAALLAVVRGAPRRVAAGYGVLVLALAAAYGLGLPAQSSAVLGRDLLAVPLFVASFLGGLFTFGLEAAMALALAGLLLFGWLAWRASASVDGGRAARLWLLIAVFALGNAGLAALARSGGGLERAVSSRYALVAALYWLALLQLGFLSLDRAGPAPRRRRALWSLVGAGMVLAMARSGGIYAPPLLRRAEVQPLVELGAKLGIEDDELVRAVLTPNPRPWRDALPVLRDHRLEPFDSPALPCGSREWLDRPFAAAIAERRAGGRLERIDALAAGSARVSGRLADGAGSCLVLLDEEGRVRGFGLPTLTIDEAETRFLGYVRVPSPASVLTAVVTLAGRPPRWLPGSVTLAGGPVSETRDPTFQILRRAGRWYKRGEALWLEP